MTEVIHAKLITYREDIGGYIIYVFQNLANGSYEMCTRLPRWESPIIRIGDKGFVKYREVIAGKDTWYDNKSNQNIPYLYTGVYFVDFVYEKPEKQDLIL